MSSSSDARRGSRPRRRGIGLEAAFVLVVVATAHVAAAQTSDEFEDASSQLLWSILNPDLVVSQDIDGTVPGALTLAPTTSVLFGGLDAPLVHQEADGAIAIEARVSLRQAADPALPLEEGFAFASIVIADPAGVPGAETWVELGLGLDAGAPAVQSTATVASVSERFVFPAPSLEADLLLCRVDSTFRGYVRYDDGLGWQLLKEWVKPCPSHVICGVATSDVTGLAGPLGVFDYARFGVPDDLDDCTSATAAPVGLPGWSVASIVLLAAALAGGAVLWLTRSAPRRVGGA